MDARFFDLVRQVQYKPESGLPYAPEQIVDLIARSCPVPSDLFNDLILQDLVNWLVRLAKDAYVKGFDDARDYDKYKDIDV